MPKAPTVGAKRFLQDDVIIIFRRNGKDMLKDNKTIELSALYEISKLLGSSFNLKSNLRGVLRVLSEYLDMNRGTVALRSNDEVSIIAAHGMSEEEIKKGRYRLGEGIIGRVAKLGSPIVVPNIGDEPLFLNKTGARKSIKRKCGLSLCPHKVQERSAGCIERRPALRA